MKILTIDGSFVRPVAATTRAAVCTHLFVLSEGYLDPRRVIIVLCIKRDDGLQMEVAIEVVVFEVIPDNFCRIAQFILHLLEQADECAHFHDWAFALSPLKASGYAGFFPTCISPSQRFAQTASQ